MKHALGVITLSFLCTALFAQKPVDVAVQQVNDRRTSGSFARLTITLELPKIASADVAASRVLVSTAIDDSGRDLIDAEGGEAQLEVNHYQKRGGNEKQPTPVTVSVNLKNPDRKATAVKQIRGEIELYMPGNDPNSVAEIPKFLSQSGKTLSHKALKANGVEIAALSASQLDAEKKRLGEAKRKEYSGHGYEGADLESQVKRYVESLFAVEPSDVLVRITDPNKRIQEISYIDAAGEVKRIAVRDDEGGLSVFSMWGDKPAPDWKLRVSMKTAKNLVRHPFSLTNVALP